jgi:hypothetical protein
MERFIERNLKNPLKMGLLSASGFAGKQLSEAE